MIILIFTSFYLTGVFEANLDNIKWVLAEIKNFIPDSDFSDMEDMASFRKMAVIRQDANTPADYVFPFSATDKAAWNQTFDSITHSLQSGNTEVALSACDKLSGMLNRAPIVSMSVPKPKNKRA